MQLVLQRTLSAIVRKYGYSLLSDSRTGPNPICSAWQLHLSISHRRRTRNVYQRYDKHTQTDTNTRAVMHKPRRAHTREYLSLLRQQRLWSLLVAAFEKKILERQATKLSVPLMLFSLPSLSPCPHFSNVVITRSSLFKWKSKKSFLCHWACRFRIY